jgi:hypothetical protein
MKKWLSHIIYIAALAVVTSCSSDLTDESALSEKVNVTFTLAMNGSSLERSADETWGNEYTPSEIGDDKDNLIDVNGLQVLIYSVDGNGQLTYWKKVEQILTTQDPTNKNIYHFTGSLSIVKKQIPQTLRIMVFANCPNEIEGTELSGLQYQKETSIDYAAERIPMWGVATYADLKLLPGTSEDLGTIYLLRAMAKVEVTLDEKLINEGKYSLDNVMLNKYNKKGFSLPSGYEKVETTSYLNTETVFNLNKSIVNERLAFKEDKNKTSYIIYIPEYDNTSQESTPSQINLTVNNKEYTLEFKNYSGTEQSFDIIRNHYYKFNITSVAPEDIEIKLYYMVDNWQTGNIEIGFN